MVTSDSYEGLDGGDWAWFAKAEEEEEEGVRQ